MSTVPFADLLKSFLDASMHAGMEVVVWSTEPNAVGASREFTASNRAGALEKARARLLVQDGAIENVAKAIHTFRFAKIGTAGPEVDPAMDFCSFLPCSGAVGEDAEGNRAPVGNVPWDKLPNEVKELHRSFAIALLAALAQEPPKDEKKSPLISLS